MAENRIARLPIGYDPNVLLKSVWIIYSNAQCITSLCSNSAQHAEQKKSKLVK